MNQTAPTPTPWEAIEVDDGEFGIIAANQPINVTYNDICRVWKRGNKTAANAAYIVKAVNERQELIDCLKYAAAEIKAFYDDIENARNLSAVSIGQFKRLKRIQEAIAKAGAA